MSDQGSFVRRVDRESGTPVLVDITPFNAGWGWSGLRVFELEPGGAVSIESQGNEMLVLPLAGSASVQCGSEEVHLQGRTSVFDAVSDFAYVTTEVMNRSLQAAYQRRAATWQLVTGAPPAYRAP